MKHIYNKFIFISIITSILFVVVGFLSMFYSNSSVSVISYLIAGLLIISGFIFVYSYKDALLLTNYFTIGALSTILGSIMLISPEHSNVLIPVVSSIWIIILSVISLQIPLMFKKSKYNCYILTILFTILTISSGILIILNPQINTEVLRKYYGIMVTVYSVSNIMNLAIYRVNNKKIIKYLDNEPI